MQHNAIDIKLNVLAAERHRPQTPGLMSWVQPILLLLLWPFTIIFYFIFIFISNGIVIKKQYKKHQQLPVSCMHSYMDAIQFV